MASSNVSAVVIAPIFLRLALGVVFIWAGMTKFMAKMEVTAEDAATLANMGAIAPPAGGPTAPAGPSSRGPGDERFELTFASFVQDGPKPATPPATDAPAAPPTAAPPAATPAANRLFVASDFPETTSVTLLHVLAVSLAKASHPPPGPDGVAPKAIWPADLGKDRWPLYLAWAVSITELAGGTLVLIGLITRLAALGIAGVMAGAMWLTTFGPAWQSGKAVLGFIPDHGIWDLMAWQTPMLQFILLCAALALVFAGAGGLSLDGLTRRPRAKPVAVVAPAA